MYFKIIFNVIAVVALSLLQSAFVSGLPLGLNNLNLLLIALVYVLVLGGFKLAGIWALGFGFLLDNISFLPYGTFMFSFFLALVIMNFLLVNFFTNRSLYAYLAMTLFASIGFFLSVYIFSMLNQILVIKGSVALFSPAFWQNGAIQIVFNLLVVLFLFYIINFLSNNLKPVFLLKKGV